MFEEAGQVAGKVKEIRAARGMEWASVEAAAVGDIIQLAVTGGGGWAGGPRPAWSAGALRRPAHGAVG